MAAFGRLYHKLTFAQKIGLIYTAFVFIPICLLMAFYFNRMAAAAESEILHTAIQALKQAAYNVGNKIDAVESTSRALINNTELLNILRSGDRRIEEQIDELTGLGNIVVNTEGEHDIYRVRLFVSPEKMYAKEGVNIFGMDTLEAISWYDDLAASGGRIYWRDTYQESYVGYGEKNVVTCARIINNPWQLDQRIGAVFIDLEEELLCRTISSIRFEKGEYVFLFNGDNRIIAHADKQKLGSPSGIDLSDFNDDGELISKRGKREYVLAKAIPGTTWKIAMTVPKKGLFGDRKVFGDVISLTIIILGLFLLLILTFFAVFASGIVRRVEELMTVLGVKEENRAARGDKPFRLFYYRKMEHTINNAQTLIKESYETKISERDARLKALQAQINPHFLYNTLDAINWMAKQGKNEETCFMISALAKYFRLTLNKGKDVVPLYDEINLAKVYISIQQKRYENLFDTFFDFADDILDCKVPKLILQPVVENALMHGIQKNPGAKGLITVKGYREAETVIVEITDNGPGMRPEAIAEILSASEGKGKEGYGLFNVNQRIKLFSQDGQCGVSIASEAGKYTTVTLVIKAKI